MGKITGFLEADRVELEAEPIEARITHFREFIRPAPEPVLQEQASRCMDCGVPYCHTGCPINNNIPEWNDLVTQGHWRDALKDLHSTNNFPEFTGRICPAPCEEACTLNLENQPVTIKSIEQALADRGWQEGWIVPQPAAVTTGKRVAIVGSGPAGLAAAQQLVRVGHSVDVYEREPHIGGLLRYGIPDFKMEKQPIERRVQQMREEGVRFHTNVDVGKSLSFDALMQSADAVLLAIGAEEPRNPDLPGQELEGVHYAMPYLVQQNRRIGIEAHIPEQLISAKGLHVVVIGGGDTASDCIGTAIRQGALQVTQLDIRPKPPEMEDKLTVWPYWATKMRTSSSQKEGAERVFQVATLRLEGDGERVARVICAEVDAQRKPIAGTEFAIQADLVLLAIGFSGVADHPLLAQARLSPDRRRRLLADDKTFQTHIPRLYVAGDARRGQSLVVWAIREGRQAARAIDEMLMGTSLLPR